MKRAIKLPLIYQQLEGDGYHIFTYIKVCDEEMFVLIDTGASKTVFSNDLLERFPLLEPQEVDEESLAAGIGEGRVEAKLVRIPKIALKKIELHGHFCGIIDLCHVKEAYTTLGLQPFEGILGGDILKLLQAEINYKLHYIKVTPPENLD